MGYLNLNLRSVDSSVLQSGCGQDPSAHFGHFVDHLDAEFADIGVVVESGFLDQVGDFALSVRCGSGGGFDHCRSLRIGQFLDATLPGNDVAYFDGQVGVFLLLAHLETRQEGKLQHL